MNVADLFRSEGFALVGASESRHYPRSIIKNMIKMGYSPEQIYPVNEKYEAVCGLRCYPALSALPAPASLVVLATRSSTIPTLLTEAADQGAKAVLVLADGFAEQSSEGKELQARVAEIAASRDICLLGPNSLGYVAPFAGVGAWAGGELPGRIRSGNVGMIFQSSGMLNLALGLAAHRHIGVRAAVSVGNEAVLDAADVIEYFTDDPHTHVITVLLESTVRPARLVRSLYNAQAAGKPVVMLKLGRSERAQRNAVAHTGRMTSSGRVWDAVLNRLGVVVVDDLDQLVTTTVMFDHRRGAVGSGGVGFATISGGDCSLLSDLCEKLGVPVPDVAPQTHRVMARALDKPALLGNPLDCENMRQEDPERFATAIDALCGDSNIDIVAYRMNLSAQPSDRLLDIYKDLLGRAERAGKMPVVLSRAAENLDTSWFEFFENANTPFLVSYYPALKAIDSLVRWTGRHRRQLISSAPSCIREAIQEYEEPASVLPYRETQDLLGRYGISYVRSFLASTPREAGALAEELGFPVVVKLASADLPHKSDAGAVRLGLGSQRDVVSACTEMAQRVSSEYPNAKIEGFEIQRMISGGTEMILGMTTDQTFGPVVLVGIGGIFTEVMHDVVLAVPPVSEEEALGLIEQLRGVAVLKGARGKPPADIAAMARLISAFSYFISEQRHYLREVDLNPVMILPEGQGAMAVDALVAVRSS